MQDVVSNALWRIERVFQELMAAMRVWTIAGELALGDAVFKVLQLGSEAGRLVKRNAIHG